MRVSACRLNRDKGETTMAVVQIVINQNGPLPISTSFQALGDGPVLLMISGSAWTQAQDVQIGAELFIDGISVGTAWLFANQSGSHMALVTVMIPYMISYAEHQITLSPLNKETSSDSNDSYLVTLLY